MSGGYSDSYQRISDNIRSAGIAAQKADDGGGG